MKRVIKGLHCIWKTANCHGCGDTPTIKNLIDYEQFFGARASDKVGLVRIFQNIKLFGRLPTAMCVLVVHLSNISYY